MFNWKKLLGSQPEPQVQEVVDVFPVEPYEYWVDNVPFSGRMVFRPLVYHFQQTALSHALFANHPELDAVLGGAAKQGQDLVHFWSQCAGQCQHENLVPAGVVDTEDFLGYSANLLNSIAVEPHPCADMGIWVVSMPKVISPAEAVFAALCRRADFPHQYMRPSPGTRYFLLERSDEEGQYMLCERTAEGDHHLLGTYPAMNSRQFAQAVAEIIAGG